MNPRRIHSLMRERFPPIEHVKREWAVVGEASQIEALIIEHVRSQDALVEVHRKLSAL